MSPTLLSAGQSLVDVAVQELGSVAALFELADANGLAITEVLTPGHSLAVPDSTNGQPAIVALFASRAYRVNTGANPELVTLPPPLTDFDPTDFSPADFLTA